MLICCVVRRGAGKIRGRGFEEETMRKTDDKETISNIKEGVVKRRRKVGMTGNKDWGKHAANGAKERDDDKRWGKWAQKLNSQRWVFRVRLKRWRVEKNGGEDDREGDRNLDLERRKDKVRRRRRKAYV